MINFKYIKFTITYFAIGFYSYAQQDLQYSHYIFNPHVINPAITGTRDVANLNLSYRNQWLSFPGAPKTIAATFTAPFSKDKAGWGLSMIGEQIGPKQVLNIGASFAYKVKTGSNSRLSLGLRGGFNSFAYKGSEVRLIDIENNAVTTDINKMAPNFDAGVYHYSKKHFIGLGVNHLLNSTLDISNSGNKLFVLQPHFYFHTGYAFPVSENITLNPTLLVRYVRAAAPSIDINLNAHFNDLFWIGTTYRLNNSLSILANISLSKSIRVGYVFDWQNNKIGTYTSNSHEIFLGFDFNNNKKQIFNPRFL
jgi:type IX secretion system PorP/SprF family membrane protein